MHTIRHALTSLLPMALVLFWILWLAGMPATPILLSLVLFLILLQIMVLVRTLWILNKASALKAAVLLGFGLALWQLMGAEPEYESSLLLFVGLGASFGALLILKGMRSAPN